MRRFSAILIALTMTLSCATRDPGDPLRPGYNTFSKEQDIEIGKEYSAEVKKQADIVDNPRLQAFVKQIGMHLAQQPQADDYPYEFTLINQPSINAFALPGGPIFIHSGLIDAADNEAQLAGVLSHEIAHVALRHGTSQASKSQMIQLPAVLAGAVLGNGGALAQIGQVGVGLGLQALITKYSRSAEKQADALGAQIMSQAGYDPLQMARFFEKLAAEGGSRPPVFLSTHPDPARRTELVQAEMATLPARQYGYETGDFNRSKTLVAQLPPPKVTEQQQEVAAAAANPVAPQAPSAAAFVRMNGGTFSFERPQGWEAFGGRDSLTIAPRQGLVQSRSGGVVIGYGAVISRYEPRYRQDLLNASWELVQQLQESNPNLKLTQSPQQRQIGGSPGLIVGLTGASPYGGAERNILLTVQRPDGLFYMVFVGPERGFAQLQPSFERMAQSIQFR
ncbi:MAG: M48 family metallopeptidase [Acidobacteria bacterium]|nr:M48 family metallopeptidase [Acidobacteriota bacterium]